MVCNICNKTLLRYKQRVEELTTSLKSAAGAASGRSSAMLMELASLEQSARGVPSRSQLSNDIDARRHDRPLISMIVVGLTHVVEGS